MADDRGQVLFIDSSFARPLLRGLVADIAVGGQFAVTTSVGMESASEALDSGGLDVVVVDATALDEGGLEAVKRIKDVYETPAIVLVGEEDGNQATTRALQMGAQDYLSKKELGPNSLVRAIRYALDRKRAEATVRRTNHQLHSTLERMIQAMALTVEARDPYTAGHQRRVADLAVAVGKSMGLDGETLEVLHLAGSIHDIGKVGVPAEILSKPGSLSNVEKGLLKAHPQVGHDILKTIDFPWPIAQIVGQHHERVDGSGYPDGLSGGQILLEAKILGVADVVEAMASHRPYRPALGIESALQEVIGKKGSLYDPGVVDACDRILSSGEFSWK